MKQRASRVVLAIILALGLTVGVTTPAQAFSTFTYTVTCPAGYQGQQLRIDNQSGTNITVKSSVAYRTPYTGIAYGSRPGASVVYWHPAVYNRIDGGNPYISQVTVTYTFSGGGNLWWYYSVGCIP